MSIRTVQSSALPPRHTAIAAKPTVNSTPWVRNPSWLALPSVSNTEEKFVGLHAVFYDSNFLALSATGNYTVDWGDGTVENISSGVQANHQYDFTNSTLNNTNGPVTFTASTSTVNRTTHGYSDGMLISFDTITTTTGITTGQKYYVVNSTANTFQVSATSGGTALTLTNDGTGNILPYKQCIVTVTPQAGQTLTNVNLNLRHTQSGLVAGTETGWLDILISGPNLSTLQVMGNSSTTNVNHRFLEQAQLISSNSIASHAYMFNSCSELKSIPVWTVKTTGTVDMSYMFQNCYSLQTVPLFNTAAVTNMYSMFYSCNSLQTVPLFNTAAVTSMTGMFQNCYSLQTVPLFNTVAVTDMTYMFYGCNRDRKSTRLNSSHSQQSRMPSSA